MLRKSKGTDLTPKREERSLRRAGEARGPFGWFEEMDRWFDEFRREFEDRFWAPLAPEGETRLRAPLVDLVDAGPEFVVTAELPGVTKDDVDIQVTPESIEVRAESRQVTEEKEKDYFFRERKYRAFHRTLPFPAETLPDRAEAILKDGVLEVRVPKKEPTPKREPVKVRVS